MHTKRYATHCRSSFWYKKQAFKPYLRAALRDHPELLAGLDFDGSTKRETADELVERLTANEAKYQKTTIQLMLEIANMERSLTWSGTKMLSILSLKLRPPLLN